MAQILRTEKLKIIDKIGSSEIVLFDNLNLILDEKDWVNISIPHGGGKTTLYKILLSQIKPNFGNVIYENKSSMDDYDKEKFLRENISAVPEFPMIEENYTVNDWVRLQTELLKPKGYKKRLKDFINLLNENNIEGEKHLTQLKLVEIRKMEILFYKLKDAICVICDDIDVGLNKDEIENLAQFLKSLNKDIAIITLSSNPVWNKYAKKVIRSI